MRIPGQTSRPPKGMDADGLLIKMAEGTGLEPDAVSRTPRLHVSPWPAHFGPFTPYHSISVVHHPVGLAIDSDDAGNQDGHIEYADDALDDGK